MHGLGGSMSDVLGGLVIGLVDPGFRVYLIESGSPERGV